MKKTKTAALLLAILMLTTITAHADWTTPEANLAHYQELYGEASEGYTRIRYNAQGPEVADIKQKLTELGFFAQRVTENYYRTLETSVRVFATQLRIGGDGSEVTPLMQAMLADTANMPHAISPAIDHFTYGWEANSTSYTAYTYQQLTRSSVTQGTRVGFQGKITAAKSSGGVWHYAITMENTPERVLYVTYQPLPRTTVFQSGDTVTVFGVTDGDQASPIEGMETPALTVAADRIGYAPQQ